MRLAEILRKPVKESASAGATGAGAIASTSATGAGPNVGTLFGGSYGQKRKSKKKSESIIKR